VRLHMECIVAWAQTRHQTDGVLEAIGGLFKAVKDSVRGFTRQSSIRDVARLSAGEAGLAPRQRY
jgi:hypothetical protein